jgi:hypothetical protein
MPQPVQIFIRIQRRHAAAAGGSDGLPVNMVGDITGGEHPREAGGEVAPPSLPPLTRM